MLLPQDVGAQEGGTVIEALIHRRSALGVDLRDTRSAMTRHLALAPAMSVCIVNIVNLAGPYDETASIRSLFRRIFL